MAKKYTVNLTLTVEANDEYEASDNFCDLVSSNEFDADSIEVEEV